MRIVVAALVVSSAALAQAPSSNPSFEVATVRSGSTVVTLPSGVRMMGAMQGGPGTEDPERFYGSGDSLRQLLRRAFDIQDFRLSAPDWIGMARFDVLAKVPPGTTKEQFNLMLQNLLEERFNLKFHRVTKEFPAYNLAIAKGGLKLKESVVAKRNGTSGIAANTDGVPRSYLGTPWNGGWLVYGKNLPMPDLTRMLENISSHESDGVIFTDNTGLTGTYDFRLEFASATVKTQDDAPLPTLSTALEKEFGLKLESTKVSLEVLVVDHIDNTPGDN